MPLWPHLLRWMLRCCCLCVLQADVQKPPLGSMHCRTEKSCTWDGMLREQQRLLH